MIRRSDMQGRPAPGRMPTQSELAEIKLKIMALIQTMARHRLEANARSTDALMRLLETWLMNLEATARLAAQRARDRDDGGNAPPR